MGFQCWDATHLKQCFSGLSILKYIISTIHRWFLKLKYLNDVLTKCRGTNYQHLSSMLFQQYHSVLSMPCVDVDQWHFQHFCKGMSSALTVHAHVVCSAKFVNSNCTVSTCNKLPKTGAHRALSGRSPLEKWSSAIAIRYFQRLSNEFVAQTPATVVMAEKPWPRKTPMLETTRGE